MSLLNATQQEQEDFFWNIIDQANDVKDFNWELYDQDEHIDTLIDKLSRTDKDHLIVFEKVMQQQLHRLYTASIAELYIVLNNDFEVDGDKIDFDDTISDDIFIYFRCWLLLKGNDFVTHLLEDIEYFVNGDYSFDISFCDAEELLYVADLANEVLSGIEESEEIRDVIYESYPEVVNYDDVEVEMDREVKGGVALHEAYPDLVEEICDVRSEEQEQEEE